MRRTFGFDVLACPRCGGRLRLGISGFALLDPCVVARGVAHRKADLESGAWEERFGHLRRFEALDVCYRLHGSFETLTTC